MTRALIVGCGYTGCRLGTRLTEMGLRVVGTTRSEVRAARLREVGIEPWVGGLGDERAPTRIAELSPQLVVYLVPPSPSGEDPLVRILGATAGRSLDAFVYASSTSVYGDHDGDWVDESSAVAPEGANARLRADGEREVRKAARAAAVPARICRIAGIYGPGRTLRRALQTGSYVLIRGRDTWVNRIHVSDLVSGLIGAWQHGADGEVYNLVDDEPHAASEFANLAADLHGLPRPSWVGESEAAERFTGARLRRKLASKRVRNRRLKKELGVRLAHPTFRSGLPASVAEEIAAAG